MPRRNLTKSYGESYAVSARLPGRDWARLRELQRRWDCSASEVIRRALEKLYHAEHDRTDRRSTDA